MKIISNTLQTVLLFALAVTLPGYAGDTGKNTATPDSEVLSVEPESTNVYMGLGGSSFVLHDDVTEEELTANTLLLTVGYQLNPYFALEGRYYQSFGDIEYDSGDRPSPNTTYDSTFTNVALFVKASYSFEKWKPYLLLGYGKLKLTNYLGANREESALQYGLGVDYKITKNLTFFVDWVRAYDSKGFGGRAKNDDLTIDLVSSGLRYTF